MKIRCCVCGVPVLELKTVSPTVHKVVTLKTHGSTVGSQQFCKDHGADAVVAQREKTSHGRRVSDEEIEQMKEKSGGSKTMSPKGKASDRYSVLSRWGLAHRCSGALQELRKKLQSSGFEAVAELYRAVNEDLEKHEGKMMDSLLGKDTEERRFYKNNAGV